MSSRINIMSYLFRLDNPFYILYLLRETSCFCGLVAIYLATKALRLKEAQRIIRHYLVPLTYVG
ncbi:MAG: hypothetical protein P4L34_04470 [Paludibacter sp.]|nr:hypothetical protein [Paludibacter sp.]